MQFGDCIHPALRINILFDWLAKVRVGAHGSKVGNSTFGEQVATVHSVNFFCRQKAGPFSLFVRCVVNSPWTPPYVLEVQCFWLDPQNS